ncbi:3-carboxy-cis,cis-muconate cycloisomerase [Phyllobacterium phragmitis]|uniref:3-carboxy-cis,cis-muconate cycloisomerase n=1 Tax=Phyllobacterium phragmitis TaxID=2670329 RepID=A0A2S9IVR5_9HYPH|nr:3-carboxy-cis,cis-muconate cycloisomerase [Phyllobacterium phragmitis]PRD44608.1 3-carboxy-cis,cis-muconate cycloisomerase [Phyllobacterium phragmitis]
MSSSVFDHPFLSGLFGDDDIAACFAWDADLRAMLIFEAALAKVQGEMDIIPAESAADIEKCCARFQPDLTELKRAVATDGVVVPELIGQLRRAIGGTSAAHVHFGATSQDVIDTSLMLRLKPVCEIFVERLSRLIETMEELERRFGDNRLMAHTRMQAAIPIHVCDRLRAWLEPLLRHRERLAVLSKTALAVQFGGAAGTLEKFNNAGPTLRAALAAELALADQPQWHSQRDRIAEFAGLFSLITGSLGKFGQDIALLALAGDEIELAGGGGSSVMPHKQNPVAAETLVALARFNAVQLSGMHQALVHEQERSGAAWTLEWMLLPQMVGATAAALRLAQETAGNIRRLGVPPET